MRAILPDLERDLAAGATRIVCQVVETRGSTPQKPGALLVIDPAGGARLGTLGGGRFEAEVAAEAARRYLDGNPGAWVGRYELDHDPDDPEGQACGGTVVVAASAWRGAGALAYVRALRGLVEAGAGFTEAVVVDPDPAGGGLSVGARYLFGPDGGLIASEPATGGEVPPGVLARVKPLAERHLPSLDGGVATLPTLPRVRLVIVGAGEVGRAVAELAARADFDLAIVDDRAELLRPARFPAGADLAAGPIAGTIPGLGVSPRDFALVLTRGVGQDREALGMLAPTGAAFLGLIGSRRKVGLILDELRAQGVDPDALARVSAPVGLPIGSRTVFEIAVSIVAELIARRNLGA